MMAEKNLDYSVDTDSGVASAQTTASPDGSPTQRQNSSPLNLGRQPDTSSFVNGQLSLSDGVLVFQEPTQSERGSDNDRNSTSDEVSEVEVVPELETQGPRSHRPINHSTGGASFTIGPLIPLEEFGGNEQSASALLLQEAQKVLRKETREQKAKLSSAEAKLVQTETQLKDTEDQLAQALARIDELERELCEMTQKKDQAEQNLAEVEARREQELKQYKNEVDSYKKRLARLEQKNESQRTYFKEMINKLEAEMEQKKQSYDKHVLELTKEKCRLEVQVANMKTEEQSLKRQIAELQRDLERQARENITEKFDEYKSNSANKLAEKDAKIQKLQQQLSVVSMDSNSSQETEKCSFKFPDN